jgi:hypothetical protein
MRRSTCRPPGTDNLSKINCFLIGGLGAIVVLGIASAINSMNWDSFARAALDESLWKLTPYRKDIEREIMKQGSIDATVVGTIIPSNKLPDLDLDYARVFSDGTIVIRHALYQQIVVWEPLITSGAISWECVVSGTHHGAPAACHQGVPPDALTRAAQF